MMREKFSPGRKERSTIFIGKWTVRIMRELKQGPQRPGRLRRRLGKVSQRMLTRTLRILESSGLIARKVTRSKPLAVEYSLTNLGRTFMRPLRNICDWANHHGKELSAAIRLVSKQEKRQ